MQWYVGGIAEAITLSKAKGAIFVVYIEGKDDQSQKITSLIDSEDLSQKLESQHFIAIKLEAGSVPHQQFSEIYKEPSVPSIYFIGKNGAPLDIITEADDLQSLLQRIENILQKAGITVAVSPADVSQNLIQTEQSNAQGNVVCDNGVCTIKKDVASTSSDGEAKMPLNPEDKVDRAKDIIQKKREEKEREEREKEIEKEIERRKLGQNVQQLKKWQEDQELKQILEEREKEKRENQLARERVLAQIAQDKAERQSKSSNSKPSSPEVSKPPVSFPPKSNIYTTRLQFKLPDGTSSTQEFANSDTLQIVVTYIRENMNLPFSDFRLSTTFPRREFTSNDYSQSLLDLQLTPNAVILVLPVNRGAISTNQGGTYTNMIWSLFTPIFQIFGYLRNVIFGTNSNTTIDKKKTGESPNKSEQPRQRPRDSTVIKRQGNIHRLGDRRDSDDESNTWNGNSTQQM